MEILDLMEVLEEEKEQELGLIMINQEMPEQ